MEKSSHYKAHCFLHVYIPWFLVAVSSYSVPLNLYKGQLFYMTFGITGAFILAKKALHSSTIDFYEEERKQLELDHKIAAYGHEVEPITIRDLLRATRAAIRERRSKDK